MSASRPLISAAAPFVCAQMPAALERSCSLAGLSSLTASAAAKPPPALARAESDGKFRFRRQQSQLREQAFSLHQKAIGAHGAGRYKAAVEMLNQALQIQPLEPSFYEQRALSRRQLSDFGGAVSDQSDRRPGYYKTH